MTQLLKDPFAEAEKLPREEQKRWSDLFAASQNKLADLAAEAIEENRSVGRSLSILIYCELPHHLEL